MITLAVAYLGFFVADSVLEVSGVLATVAAGITLALLGRSSIRGRAAVHQVTLSYPEAWITLTSSRRGRLHSHNSLLPLSSALFSHTHHASATCLRSQVWETIEHVGYTLIFLLAGNIFGMVLAEPNNGVGLREWGWLLLLWLALLAIRGCVIAAFYPVLDVLGYGLHWKVQTVSHHTCTLHAQRLQV